MLAKVLGTDHSRQMVDQYFGRNSPVYSSALRDLGIKPAGSPDGDEPVQWPFIDAAGEIIGVTAPDEPEENS